MVFIANISNYCPKIRPQYKLPPMTRSDLITQLHAAHPHLTAKDIEFAVKTVLDTLSNTLAQGERIEIRGFGSFGLNHRPPRNGRNPITGEAVLVPAKVRCISRRVEILGGGGHQQMTNKTAKLLKDEIKLRSVRNHVQSRACSEMLKSKLNAYQYRAIATQEVIEELIKLAKEMDAATKRGEDLGLNDDDIAFYDALADSESAVQAMGNDELKIIAAELVTQAARA